MKNIAFLEEISDKNSFLSFLKKDEIRECVASSLFNQEMIPVVFDALNGFTDEQEKLFLRFIHYVDKKMISQTISSKNMKNKIMTILSGSIYIGNFYDKIRHYDLAHLMSISNFSFLDSLEEYSLNLMVLDKELFDIYQEKTKDYMYYLSFNELAIKLYDEGYSKEEIIAYISKRTSQEILWEVGDYINEIVEKGGFSL